MQHYVYHGEIMKTVEAIRSRRSIKHFDSSHIMSAEEVNEILSLAILAPTAFNIQNWRFVVVSDADLRNKIKEAAWGQSQVTDTSLFIVLCADLKAWEKEPGRYWANAPKEVQAFMLPGIDNYYRGKEQVQRDETRQCAHVALLHKQ